MSPSRDQQFCHCPHTEISICNGPRPEIKKIAFVQSSPSRDHHTVIVPIQRSSYSYRPHSEIIVQLSSPSRDHRTVIVPIQRSSYSYCPHPEIIVQLSSPSRDHHTVIPPSRDQQWLLSPSRDHHLVIVPIQRTLFSYRPHLEIFVQLSSPFGNHRVIVLT